MIYPCVPRCEYDYIFILTWKPCFQFIIDEVARNCVEIATNKSGCSILQKCLHLAKDNTMKRLIDEIVSHASLLTEHPFGYLRFFIFLFPFRNIFFWTYTSLLLRIIIFRKSYFTFNECLLILLFFKKITNNRVYRKKWILHELQL